MKMAVTWIIQRKIMRGDWKTIGYCCARTKTEALQPYKHMNGSLRAVSEQRALADYLLGRADDHRLARGRVPLRRVTL